MKIQPTIKLVANNLPMASTILTPFESHKIHSPGIRQALMNDLNKFLNSVADNALLLPEEAVEPRVLHAEELRQLADLVEKGERDVTAAIYYLTDHKLIHIELKD